MQNIAETLADIAGTIIFEKRAAGLDEMSGTREDIARSITEDWQVTGGDPKTGIATATDGTAVVRIHADDLSRAEYYEHGTEWALTCYIDITDRDDLA